MKTFLSNFYNIKIFFFLIITLLINENSFAQQDPVAGPFTYSPPDALVNLIWSDVDSNSKQELNIYMNNIPSPVQGDGIMVKFNLNLNCNTGTHSNIFHVFDDTCRIIRFQYSNKSIDIYRYWTNNSKSYDYTVYDQLFDSTTGMYEMKLYITADFMFIVSKSLASGANKSYLFPVLFGLNSPGKNVMSKLINRNSDISLRVGSQFSDNRHRISNTSLYYFSYSALRKNILDNFVNK
jgi:hypothetical protein